MEEHKHTHGEHCGCRHDHHHEEHCGCRHDHHHEEHCGCGHDHHHEYHEEHHIGHEFEHVSNKIEQRIYILENLGCANCAAKMEKQINELSEVEMATITFATKQLRVAANHQEKLLPKFREICSSIESEVVLIPIEENVSAEKKEKKNIFEENKNEFLAIGSGAVLFAIGILLENILVQDLLSGAVFVVAYILLGREIIATAAKNLVKGHVFDENFLMTIATVAAFGIGEFPEAVGVMLFYRVGELFEHIAVERSRGQIMEAVDMRPEVVNIIASGNEHEVPANEVKVGDVILVRPGDRIPLDGVVLEGNSRIDTSPMTGEPVPVSVEAGSEVLSGCVNESGVLKMKVLKPLEESMVTRILDSVENAAASKPKMDRFITRFARIYTPIIVVVAVITAVIPSVITGDWNYWIYTAITFLVISCPCALVLSVPLAFFSGIGAGSTHGILFKGGVVMEALKHVKAVVMDKTGTITKGEFVVQNINPIAAREKEEILRLAAECELGSNHPIAISIVEMARGQKLDIRHPEQVEEISGKGIRMVTAGKEVLCGNQELLKECGINIPETLSEKYGTEVFLAEDGKYIGKIHISDTIKTDANKAICDMQKQNLRTVMLTGDSRQSAEEVAKQTGIQEVYAKLLPADKLAQLEKVRRKYGPVLFVGDGINDAPVLAGADVGAAMGSGADAAIEAADIVFMNSSVEAITQAIYIARKTGNVAMQNVVGALVIKALVMILGFFGLANMWMAVFADTGVAMLCVLNSMRILYTKNKN